MRKDKKAGLMKRLICVFLLPLLCLLLLSGCKRNIQVTTVLSKPEGSEVSSQTESTDSPFVKGTIDTSVTLKPVVKTDAPAPTEEPTPEPTEEPTPEPTPEPTEEPTPEPTEEPTPEPTEEPTPEPTPEPTEEPTPEPTEEPTPEPTEEPTPEPTEEPTPEPTEESTPKPTEESTPAPTEEPTPEPMEESTPAPTPDSVADAQEQSYIPEKFRNTELLPTETVQVVNAKKATYERLGFDKAQKKALEKTETEGKTLPVIFITTKDGEYVLSRTEYSSCVVDVVNCPEKWTIDEASAGVRLRGKSSAYYGNVEKIMANPVPYRIKFDKKTNLLGLNNGGKGKSWVLLKAGYDLIRNDFAFRLGRAIIGDHTFCSDTAYVHLYVNDVYQGVYTLCEQSQVNKSRVNVSEPEAGYTGIDIGYFLVIDNNPEPPYSFKINYGKHEVKDIEGEERAFVSTYYTIKSDVNTVGQVDFITQYMKNVFEIVYQACEKNNFLTMDENYELVSADFTSAQETVEAVLDVQSVVDMYLLYEVMHDYDVGEGSFYMCVDFSRNSKCPRLQFTSPWDFNWTCEGSTERYWAGAFCEPEFVSSKGDRTNPWFVVLIKQDWFRDLAAKKWTELAEDNAVRECVNQETEILETCKDEFTAWKAKSVRDANKVLNWLKARIDWMDTQFLYTAEQNK